MSRYLGCHVSCAGGFEKSLHCARELDVNAIQLHPSPPQRWNTKPYPDGYESAFLDFKRAESKVEKIFFHAIYLINLATPDNRQYALGKMSLKHYLDLSDRIGGDGVVVHVGSTVNQPTEMDGFKRAAEAIAEVLDDTASQRSRLLLEVAAGGGATIGDEPEELQIIASMLPDTKRLGFALDTQHLWASGVDIRNTDEAVSRVKSAFGDKIELIHLNDSMTELGSRKDRHANLGEGKIGLECLANFVNHRAFEGVPVILETPGLRDIETGKIEVQKLRQLAS